MNISHPRPIAPRVPQPEIVLWSKLSHSATAVGPPSALMASFAVAIISFRLDIAVLPYGDLQ